MRPWFGTTQLMSGLVHHHNNKCTAPKCTEGIMRFATQPQGIHNIHRSAPANNAMLLLCRSDAKEKDSPAAAKWSPVLNHLINWRINSAREYISPVCYFCLFITSLPRASALLSRHFISAPFKSVKQRFPPSWKQTGDAHITRAVMSTCFPASPRRLALRCLEKVPPAPKCKLQVCGTDSLKLKIEEK